MFAGESSIENLNISKEMESFLSKKTQEDTIENLLENMERPRAKITVTTADQNESKGFIESLSKQIRKHSTEEKKDLSIVSSNIQPESKETEETTELKELFEGTKGIEIKENKGIKVVKSQSHKLNINCARPVQDV